MNLQNGTYGLLSSALMFYLKLATDLKNNGFVINPYDPCMAKKLVKGGAIKVVWDVEYLKLLRKDPIEVTNFAQYLSTIYSNKLNINRVKIHYYLGMNLDYSETGVVNILMIKYLQKVLDKFPEDLRGTLATQ